MKKWKHLLKAVMAVGVIAMTAVQICAAAEGTAQAAASEVTPVSISTNEIAGWPAGPLCSPHGPLSRSEGCGCPPPAP